MKVSTTSLTAAAALLLAAPLLAPSLLAQSAGVSRPEDLNDSLTTSAPPSAHYVKPSPAVPPPAAAPALHEHETTTYGAFVPYNPGGPAASVETARTDSGKILAQPYVVTDDINSGIVTEVAMPENGLPEGTLIPVRLEHEISTTTTPRGTVFHARLTRNVERRGIVVLPAGAVLTGRVTEVHGGRRISGAPSIHLQPDTVMLPDGVTYRLDAQVIDVLHRRSSHVSQEGTIKDSGNTKGTAAAIGLTTGSAAVAGAVVGGGVGALVGAGIGAGVGTIWWLKHEQQATLPQGTEVVFSLNRPMFLEPAVR